METPLLKEMKETIEEIKDKLSGRTVYLFGHCEATVKLADLLMEEGIRPKGILDNSAEKQGQEYRDVPVIVPVSVMQTDTEHATVLIATRFYEAMNAQLKDFGFRGDVIKVVDYNTYAEYSLTVETWERKVKRVEDGKRTIDKIKENRSNCMILFCPFNALGDVYFMMSYLPAFLRKKGIRDYVVCVPSRSCAAVVDLFASDHVITLLQKDLDAAIQAAIYNKDEDCFITHQDRPYVVNLHRILKMKRISLEKVYCCGVFGLPDDTEPVQPTEWKVWDRLEEIREGKAVILSPYAKSVTGLPMEIWEAIISDFSERGYQLFTNVAGEETPLPGTEPLNAKIGEMKSVVERAGTFIGIRSGLCDVIRTAACRKVALYPDYNYCDTKWKSIDMYAIDGFENLVVDKGFRWHSF